MDPIWLDIADDLEMLGREARMVREAVNRYWAAPAEQRESDPYFPWEKTSAIASGLESAYSGIERLFRRIAERFDGNVPEGKDWHADLLRRMARPNPDIRPVVISRELHRELDGFRGFRHRQRNQYNLELKTEQVVEYGERIEEVVSLMVRDLNRFAQTFEGPNFSLPIPDSFD